MILSKQVTTLATCWKLSLRNGQVIGFTDHQENIKIDEVIYHAQAVNNSSIISSNSLSIDNLEIEGILTSDLINHIDILANKYDFAKLEIFSVDYLNVNAGKVILKKGYLGEIRINNQQFIAELRGVTERLTNNIGESYSDNCRAEFGDYRCKLKLTDFTKNSSITKVISNNEFIDDQLLERDGYYNNGIIEFISGKNQGVRVEIINYFANKITLSIPTIYNLEVNDQYLIQNICNKTISNCAKQFNNAINFRGEPNIPGLDKTTNI